MDVALSRETLSNQLADRLMALIATQNLEPGNLLPSESKLAQEFGVSRPIVREALKSLAAQGVIETISGKGAIIRPMDDRLLRLFFQRAIDIGDGTLKELVEIRKPLEVQSAMLAAQRRTPQDLAQLKGVLAAMCEHLDDLEHYAELDITFHLHIASASRNQMLYHLIRSTQTLLQSVALRGLRNLRDIHETEYVQQLHEAITEAIERQDIDAARQAMDLHFETVVKTLFRAD